VVAPEVEEPAKVVDLMEALRRSLNTVSAEKKKPAKADLPKAKAKGQKVKVAAAANGSAKKRKAS
jgi:non-homologous end joining protein Ku